MILTPVAPADLPRILAIFEAGLGVHDSVARAALARIVRAPRASLSQAEEDAARDRATGFAHRLGIATLDDEPAKGFSWDGQMIRTRSEPSVLLHEIAHWLICPAARRPLLDFGLGAGPESGRKAEADAARVADPATQEREEAMASLLGILWEAEFGLPAIAAFAEQNWLEQVERPGTPAYFATVIDWLQEAGLIDGDARPIGGDTLVTPLG